MSGKGCLLNRNRQHILNDVLKSHHALKQPLRPDYSNPLWYKYQYWSLHALKTHLVTVIEEHHKLAESIFKILQPESKEILHQVYQAKFERVETAHTVFSSMFNHLANYAKALPCYVYSPLPTRSKIWFCSVVICSLSFWYICRRCHHLSQSSLELKRQQSAWQSLASSFLFPVQAHAWTF